MDPNESPRKRAKSSWPGHDKRDLPRSPNTPDASVPYGMNEHIQTPAADSSAWPPPSFATTMYSFGKGKQTVTADYEEPEMFLWQLDAASKTPKKSLTGEELSDAIFAKHLQAELDLERSKSPIGEPASPKTVDPSLFTETVDSSRDVDNSADALVVQTYVQGMSSIVCACCGLPLCTMEAAGVARLFKEWMERQSQKPMGLMTSDAESSAVVPAAVPAFEMPVQSTIYAGLTCSACLTLTCPGCSQKWTEGPQSNHTTGSGLRWMWCCDQGRLFLVWILLCGYDNQMASFQPSVKSKRTQSSPHTRRDVTGGAKPLHHSVHRPAKSSGIGYGGSYGGSYGGYYGSDQEYADMGNYPNDDEDEDKYVASPKDLSGLKGPWSDDRTAAFKAMLEECVRPTKPRMGQKRDDLTIRVMTALAVLLPGVKNQSNPSTFDLEPPLLLIPILRRSSILNKAAELLCNDSLEDNTRRAPLYEALLSFIRALVSHPATSQPVVCREREVMQTEHNLLRTSYATPGGRAGRTIGEQAATDAQSKEQPLVRCMENLLAQSEIMIASARARPAVFETNDAQQMLYLCHQIVEIAAISRASSSMDTTSAGFVTPTGGPSDPPTPPADCQTALTLQELPDELVFAHHAYANEARGVSDATARRMRTLARDLQILRTGLPPGIFVRYASSRMDVMKVVILGPADTPYANGCFEFDLFCPAVYPSLPPSMKFRTTGGGRALFNPNLYPCGKVCLSLLGTWPGETWRPGQSTLLQIFVSIQAMVFCDEPWCNEPSRESQRGKPQSFEYNETIRVLTLRHALLPWVKGEEHAIWNDVVRNHFTNKGNEILETVHEWVTAKPVAPLVRNKWSALSMEDDDLVVQSQSMLSSAPPGLNSMYPIEMLGGPGGIGVALGRNRSLVQMEVELTEELKKANVKWAPVGKAYDPVRDVKM